MNIILKYQLFTLFLLSPFYLIGQESTTLSLPDFDTFLSDKETKKQTGIFPLYYNEKSIYLEIKSTILNKNLLIVAQIENGHNMRGHLLKSIQSIRFTIGNQKHLYLHQNVYPERVSKTESINLQKVLSKSNLLPIYKKYTIEAYSPEKKSYLIDISDDLLTNDSWFEIDSKNKLRGLKANESCFLKVTSIDNGIVFHICRMYGIMPAAPQGSDPILTTEGYAPLRISCSLQILPIEKMSVRSADTRIGFSSISYTDYGKYPYGAIQESIIQRWNLPHRNGKLKVTIDSAFPSLLIPLVKEAFMQWNSVFEEAGYKNVFEIRLQKTSDDRWKTPIYVSFGINEAISSSTIVEAETGEILYACIHAGNKDLENYLNDYFLSCAQPLFSDVDKITAKNRIFQSLITKEIGYILGLKNNYRGSSAYSTKKIQNSTKSTGFSYTASIMDCNPFNYVIPACENTSISARMPINIGAYDKYAIRWAYGKYNYNKENLSGFLNKAINRKEYLFSDNTEDIQSKKNDLASDKLQASEQGLLNLYTAFSEMEKYLYQNTEVSDKGSLLHEMQKKGIDKYTQYLTIAGDYIGSTSANEEFIALSSGKKAMMFINRYLFLFKPEKFCPPSFNQNPLLNAVDNQLYDYASVLFEQFLSKKVILHLTKALCSSEAYHINVFRKDMLNILFPDFSKERKLTAHQMELQNLFIRALNKQIKTNENKNNVYSYQLYRWKQEIQNNITKLINQTQNNMSGLYFNYLSHIVQQTN